MTNDGGEFKRFFAAIRRLDREPKPKFKGWLSRSRKRTGSSPPQPASAPRGGNAATRRLSATSPPSRTPIASSRAIVSFR